MKIGVVTTQYAPNYGALLQAYSLQRFINNNIKDCEVLDIDYWPEYTRSFWKVINKKKGIKDNLLVIFFLLHPQWIIKKKKCLQKMWKFRQEYIKCTKPYYETCELEENPDHFDVLICGSDQIWNVSRPEYTPVNFLSFAHGWKQKRLISYAPSVATNIPEHLHEEIRQYLSDFYAISVREENDVDQIEKLANTEVKHVCDPVFLTSQKEWETIIPPINIHEPYILCYFISVGDYAPFVVKKMRAITGCKIVYVNVNVRDKFDSDYNIRDVAPLELVSYIRHAKYICTNSFHCTAFSVLFKKNLIVIKKDSANSRIESLLKMCHAEDCLISEPNCFDFSIEELQTNYCEKSLSDWIEKSKRFLIDSLTS